MKVRALSLVAVTLLIACWSSDPSGGGAHGPVLSTGDRFEVADHLEPQTHLLVEFQADW